jgi:hypothetical protein
MTERLQAFPPAVSVVVPVLPGHDRLPEIYRVFSRALERLGQTYEFLFVVDGGQESVVPALRELKSSDGGVRIIVMRRPYGPTGALAVGLRGATGGSILTVPSFFQVDASAVEPALSALERGADLVVGRRHPRRDSYLSRLDGAAFHWLVRWMTGTSVRDVTCEFRAMKRQVAEEVVLYGNLHRFLPVLAKQLGFRIEEAAVTPSQDDASRRHRGPGTYFFRLLDLLAVFFLVRFTKQPFRFFGLLGSAVFLPGLGITLYLGLHRLLGFGGIANRPLLLLGVLLMVLGFQTLSIGLIGEIIIFVHAKDARDYQIAEIL